MMVRKAKEQKIQKKSLMQSKRKFQDYKYCLEAR